MTIKTPKELEDYITLLDVDFDFEQIVESFNDEQFLSNIPFDESIAKSERNNWLFDTYVKLRQGLLVDV